MAGIDDLDLSELVSKVMSDGDLLEKLKGFDLSDVSGVSNLLGEHGINVTEGQVRELASKAQGLLGHVDLDSLLSGFDASKGLDLGGLTGMMGGLFGRR